MSPIVSLAGTDILTSGNAPDTGTVAAARVADILLLFAGPSSVLGVSELARLSGLSKAVVHRILQSLASRDLVTFEDQERGYRLGPAALALGARAQHGLNLRSIALPVIHRLRDETGETTTVSSLVGLARVYLDQVVSPHEVKMTVELGRLFPLHAGASSKAILAFAPTAIQRHVLAEPLSTLTPRTVVDHETLGDELAEIRRTGVAVSLGERQEGAGSVASPVLGHDGYAVGCISTAGPVDRFDRAAVDRMAPLVRQAAGQISEQLGWQP